MLWRGLKEKHQIYREPYNPAAWTAQFSKLLLTVPFKEVRRMVKIHCRFIGEDYWPEVCCARQFRLRWGTLQRAAAKRERTGEVKPDSPKYDHFVYEKFYRKGDNDQKPISKNSKEYKQALAKGLLCGVTVKVHTEEEARELERQGCEFKDCWATGREDQ